jgi:hypothetical protein
MFAAMRYRWEVRSVGLKHLWVGLLDRHTDLVSLADIWRESGASAQVKPGEAPVLMTKRWGNPMIPP